MPKLHRNVAFWTIAVTLGGFLFASSAPSPLYVVYQDRFDFSTVTLTAVFAVYALALLATLLVVGSVSDHIGRRPTLLVALAIEILAMVAFAEADAVGVLVGARVLQGVATGIAMGALSAALLDLEPESRPTLGSLMGVAAPMSGLAIGALATGLLVDHGPAPTAPRVLAARDGVRPRLPGGAGDARDGAARRRLAALAAPADRPAAAHARALRRRPALPGRHLGAGRPGPRRWDRR